MGLDPPPEKRPKVWDCDDCLMERGKPPNNNVRKRNGLEPGRNLPRISSASHLIGMSSSAVSKKGGLSNKSSIRVKVDGPSGDDSASGSGSSSDSSNESDEESDGRRKSRRNKTTPASSNTSNSFFSNNFKDNSGKKPLNKSMLMNSSSSSLPANNSLLSYRNNESTFKSDSEKEDNGAGAEKPSGIGLSGDKAQDSDSAQHSLID